MKFDSPNIMVINTITVTVALLIILSCVYYQEQKTVQEFCFEGACSQSVTSLFNTARERLYVAEVKLAECKATKGPNVEVKIDFVAVKAVPGPDAENRPFEFSHNYVSMGNLMSEGDIERMKKAVESTYRNVGEAYSEANQKSK